MSRAQLSLEALLLFLVFLSLLGIAYLSTTKIGSAAQEKIAYELAKSSFEDFSSKLSSACSMGEGNVRVVEIQGNKAAIRMEGNTLAFSSGKFASSFEPECEVLVLKEEPSANFIITNARGIIEIG